MTGVQITGPAAPTQQSILTVVDLAGQEAMKRAREIAVEEWAAQAPHGPTGLLAEPSGRVTKTKTGWRLTLQASRSKSHGGQGRNQATVAQVARWVTRGTGLYRTTPGGSKHKIHASKPFKRMVLPGGTRRWSVKGQHPNPFIARARDAAHARVEAALREGAGHAAAKLRERR